MDLCSVYHNKKIIITKVETDYDVLKLIIFSLPFFVCDNQLYTTVKSCLKDEEGNQNIPWQLAHVLEEKMKKKQKGQMM